MSLVQEKKSKHVAVGCRGERAEAPGVDAENLVFASNLTKPFCLAESVQDVSPIEMWLKARRKEGSHPGVGAAARGWGLPPSLMRKWGCLQSAAQQLSQHVGENLLNRKKP